MIARRRRLAGQRRQLGDRIDLERGADAQQDVGAGGQRERALERALGQELAEQDDVGLERVAAVAARHAVGCGGQRARTSCRPTCWPHVRHDEWSIVPWTSMSSCVPAARCSRSMFW
jgi:hypothetical protein